MGTARCDECQVAFEWAGGAPRPKHPFIKPGDPLLFFDCTRHTLPGQTQMAAVIDQVGSRFDGTPQGSLITIMPKRAMFCSDPKLRARDGCVRVGFVALDPFVVLGCSARVEKLAETNMQYYFAVSPSTKTARLARGFSGAKDAQYTDLQPWSPCNLIAPPGVMNVVELRVQGPTLEARLNDKHVFTVHDPVLGIGGFGLRVESHATAQHAQRVMVAWFEVREVVA